MIGSISISNYKSFHPTTPVEITFETATRKPVLIYGINGAGKSAIGEVIHRWGLGDASVAHCRISTVGQGPFRPMVYNHEFVERVIGNVAGMPGIFTLGELDTQSQKEIDTKANESAVLEERRDALKGLTSSVEQSISNLKATALTEVWKAHTANIQGDLGHLMPGYGNSRQKFFDDLQKIVVADDESLDTQERLKQRWDDAAGSEPRKAVLSVHVSGFDVIEEDAVWTEKVAISSESKLALLVEKWGNGDWVSQGRSFAHDSDCPFCQQPLPADFLSELSKLLDGDRQHKIAHIQAQSKAYENLVDALGDAMQQVMAESFAQQDDGLAAAWAALQTACRENVTAMKTKVERPGETVSVSITDASALQSALSTINQRIGEFNQRVADRDAEKKRIKDEFWKLLRRDRSAAYSAFDAALTPLSEQLNKHQEEDRQAASSLRTLTARLSELRRQQTGVDAAVAAINQRLLAMGVASFSITSKQGEGSLYCLQRPDQPEGALKSLSEGEKTLISFLYYMELLKGSEQEGQAFAIDKTLVVIDDPISSLSVNYVFDVASIIHYELIAPRQDPKVRQVIVLTHNLFFLHELLRQVAGRNLDKAGDKCQLIRVVKSSHTQVLRLKATDLLNDYDALWLVLREARDRQLPAQIVPNTMRCILEHFFSFNNREDDFKKALEGLERADNQFTPLARFLDRGSHRDGINFSVMDYGEHDVTYYLEKFRAVFHEAGFPQHFDARMATPEPAPTTTTAAGG